MRSMNLQIIIIMTKIDTSRLIQNHQNQMKRLYPIPTALMEEAVMTPWREEIKMTTFMGAPVMTNYMEVMAKTT